jgi:hypothetical protein
MNRFDASFFGKVFFGALLAASLGCFGVAGSTLASVTSDPGIVSVSAVYGARKPEPARIRVGIMTERVRGNSAAQLARVDR